MRLELPCTLNDCTLWRCCRCCRRHRCRWHDSRHIRENRNSVGSVANLLFYKYFIQFDSGFVCLHPCVCTFFYLSVSKRWIIRSQGLHCCTIVILCWQPCEFSVRTQYYLFWMCLSFVSNCIAISHTRTHSIDKQTDRQMDAADCRVPLAPERIII